MKDEMKMTRFKDIYSYIVFTTIGLRLQRRMTKVPTNFPFGIRTTCFGFFKYANSTRKSRQIE